MSRNTTLAVAMRIATMGVRGRAYFEQHFEREMLLTKLEGWMQELKPVS